jgi:NAD(P)-dependent dehydrogenase (short-subunit alcohol dehydrogenase family)
MGCSIVGFANTPGYSTSKHAVVGMTKQMAIDYAQDRIHVNALCPGFVDTPMNARTLGDADVAAGLTSLHPWGSLGMCYLRERERERERERVRRREGRVADRRGCREGGGYCGRGLVLVQ